MPRYDEKKMARKRALGVSSDRDPRIVFEGFDEITIRPAVMLVQMSNTRFASPEGVLDAFIRSITVLQTLVSEKDFYTELYKPKNQKVKDDTIQDIVSLVEDLQFEIAMRVTHMILVLLPRYLRLFDSNDVRISEVYPIIKELERKLDGLPLSEFLTPERKAELMTVFRLCKDGPIGRKLRVRLLEYVHCAAYLLDPIQAPRQPGSLKSHFHAHAERYAAAAGISDTSSWISKLMFKYAYQVENWYAARDVVEGKNQPRSVGGQSVNLVELCWSRGHNDCRICLSHLVGFTNIMCSRKEF